MDQSSLVAIALAGLWIAYLVPHRLRYRQQLLDSCVEDRFSGELRVLRVAGVRAAAHEPSSDRDVAVRSTGRIHPVRERGERRPGEQSAARERGGRTMDRPHAHRDRAVADAARHTAAEHAARAAYLARRAAAARRRAALTVVLLLAVVAGWGAAAVGSVGIAAGVVPSCLLAGVLVLGRRAVIAGARADARWAAGEGARPAVADAVRAARSVPGATVVGRAVHPSDATTEVMARVGERRDAAGAGSSPAAQTAATRVAAESQAAESEAAESQAAVAARQDTTEGRSEATREAPQEESSTWVPVPVPRPAYTLKPMARRPEPAPLVLDAEPGASAGGVAAGSDGPAAVVDDDAPTTGGLDLDAILARRRAAGE